MLKLSNNYGINRQKKYLGFYSQTQYIYNVWKDTTHNIHNRYKSNQMTLGFIYIRCYLIFRWGGRDEEAG